MCSDYESLILFGQLRKDKSRSDMSRLGSSIKYVVKRNGHKQAVNVDKITSRNSKLCYGLDESVVAERITERVVRVMQNGMTTAEMDELSTSEAVGMITDHPDYGKLGARICVSNLHKQTDKSFVKAMRKLHQNVEQATGTAAPLLRDEVMDVIEQHGNELDAAIVHDRDFDYDYFGFSTLCQGYLTKVDGKIVETPQHMIMRVAVSIHMHHVERVLETYDTMSKGYFTHASPTLFYSGAPRAGTISCFLMTMEDSIRGIYKVLSDCALISKSAGGIGISISKVRARGSYIKGSGGVSKGIANMIRVLNSTARYVDQGSRRKGAFAVYLEPWHGDVLEFLELRKPNGVDETRAKDMFYGLWIPDIFMERVEKDQTWSLMCPNQCPGLTDTYGDEFHKLYEKYEAEGRFLSQMPARKLWNEILQTQAQTGTPYILYKDAVNKKNAQKNIGMINSSNLCVAPDTRILTRQGYRHIGLLKDQKVEVWNGQEWSQVTIKQTSPKEDLFRVRLQSGKYVDCTAYHKFYLADGTEARTHELKPGQVLNAYERPPVEDQKEWQAFQETHPNPSHTALGVCVEPEAASILYRMGCYVTTTESGFVLPWEEHPNRELPLMPTVPNTIIKEVIDLKRTSEVYCFEEPKRHRGVFNGILTGQCSEIVEVHSSTETAACNLASVALPKFVKNDRFDGGNAPYVDFEELRRVMHIVTRNLNNVMDSSFYPVPEAELSNNRHRPIGIGVQGLAELFIKMNMAYDSKEAQALNKEIFEHMYYYALEASCALARETEPYSTFVGSPASRGELQFHMWDVKPGTKLDWAGLIDSIKTHGLRNSLLIALMPTASTSQILGNTESFEPLKSNAYLRRTLAGEFLVTNTHLVTDLIREGLWTDRIRREIMLKNGMIQGIEEIPLHIRQLYKTVWEISGRTLIDMQAARGPFVDQAQSFNVFMHPVTTAKLTSSHFHAWKSGCKNAIYYLKLLAVQEAQKVMVEESIRRLEEEEKNREVANEIEDASSTSGSGDEREEPESLKEYPQNEPESPQGDDIMSDEIIQPMFCNKDNPDCLTCSG